MAANPINAKVTRNQFCRAFCGNNFLSLVTHAPPMTSVLTCVKLLIMVFCSLRVYVSLLQINDIAVLAKRKNKPITFCLPVKGVTATCAGLCTLRNWENGSSNGFCLAEEHQQQVSTVAIRTLVTDIEILQSGSTYIVIVTESIYLQREFVVYKVLVSGMMAKS